MIITGPFNDTYDTIVKPVPLNRPVYYHNRTHLTYPFDYRTWAYFCL